MPSEGTAVFTPSPKQSHALMLLERSKQITDICYGGAAGGGKTVLGCAWQLMRRQALPESRGCIFRKVKKTLKDTTINTFHQTAKMMGFIQGYHYDHPGTSDTIRFSNGSTITLLDIVARPTDPQYERLGGYEFTDAFGDEAAECPEKGVEILTTRIRYKCAEYGLEPKLLLTCNPTKRWLRKTYYEHFIAGTLKPYQAFVTAKLTDNPDKAFQRIYRKQLMKRSQADRLRLLEGVWNFDDDPFALVSYQDVADLTKNIFVQGGKKMATIDVALHGSDMCVMAVWNGWRCERLVYCNDLSPRAVEYMVRHICSLDGVSIDTAVIDSSGVGAWLSDYLEGSTPYAGSAKPTKERYYNMRSQCGFLLAKKIKDREVYLNPRGCYMWDAENRKLTKAPAAVDMATTELELLSRVDRDDKMQLVLKKHMKEDLGRSPDFQDAFLMRALPTAKGYNVLASSI